MMYLFVRLLPLGRVTAWGYYLDPNDDGSSPVFVPNGLSNIVAIATGLFQSLALRPDGTVIAWGPSSFSIPVPKVPAAVSDAVAIASGEYPALALKNDGTVISWGYINGSGAYVDCLDTNAPSGLTNIVGIAAGETHKLALKEEKATAKSVLYLFRVVMTGLHLLRTGEVEANLLQLNKIFQPLFYRLEQGNGFPFILGDIINR